MEQTPSAALADALAQVLFTQCLRSHGEAFTICRTLGSYRQHFIRTETGWQCDRSPDTAMIAQMTAQARQFAAQFPAVCVTYPHTVTQDLRDCTTELETWVTSVAEVHISVPADFVRAYDGSDELELLMQTQPAAIAALAEDIRQRLLRYELRTAQMFSHDDTHFALCFAVQQDAITTEIWHLSLKKHGIAPLETENAQCAMARAMAATLAELLHCEANPCCTVTQGFHRAYTVQLTIEDTGA